MAASKLNVLMWHIVDGNSFPLKLDAYPELAEKVLIWLHVQPTKRLVGARVHWT